tara:strand:- start:536 stop:1261 length:726 start_codon:yes stop_codon:yes gene_type:complete
MFKRGQVTIFVIIAVIILAAIIIFFMTKDNLGVSNLPPHAEEIYSFTQSCLEEKAKEVVYEIGQSGGYYFPTEPSTYTGIPYYYSENGSHMPSKSELEEEISFFVNKKLFICTKGFIDFPDVKINQEEVKTITTINDEEVILDVEYPIRVIKGEDITILKEFDTKVKVRLGIIYDSIAELMQDQLTRDGICLTCISDIVTRNDLYVEMFDYDNETIIFTFRDENLKLNDEFLEFSFANRYN